MIEHVYRRSALCEALDEVYVATCDEEIRECVSEFGGQTLMTSPDHQRASERTAEAAADLDSDIVVMIQGDEPMIVPEMIDSAVAPMLQDPSIQCVNLVERIESEEEFRDTNTIKVVMDLHKNALYFSREPIPTGNQLGFKKIPVFKQVCVIPFRKDFLIRYSQLPPTPLEQSESIDMLRILENRLPVRLVETRIRTHSVDTPSDLAHVESRMRQDPLLSRYPPKAGTEKQK